MSQTTNPASEVRSQYAAQVAADLERNARDQERIGNEIAALQQQLTTLQHDHAVLVTMQQALGIASAPTEPAAAFDGATVPAPRQEALAGPGRGKRARAKTAQTDQPTLVELVRGHLTEQHEPRSAAEIATALGEAHADRGIKTTVVRSTLEGLVAKHQAQRTKQGSAVFYSAPDAAAPTAANEAEDRPEQDRQGNQP